MNAPAQRAHAWIPPEPLVFAQASLFASWVLLFIAGQRNAFEASPIGFAWIHSVVLGWITSTALAFLVHVLPMFADTPLRLGRLARGAAWLFQPGTVAIVVGFALWIPVVIMWGGGAVVIAIGMTLASFLATAAAALQNDHRTTRAVARAFCIVVVILGVTVALGFAMSMGLFTGSSFAIRLAGLHAALGVFGWLGLLVAGVSARTYNVLLGRAVGRTAHIVVSSLVLAGLAASIAGMLLLNTGVTIAGGATIALGAIVACTATAGALRHGTAGHRLPREFATAATFWLGVAVGYGIAGLIGREVSAALLLAILLGWIGQNINAHMMHVGIRLLATLLISDDDETRPRELLNRRIGVISFVLYQVAIAAAIVAVTIASGVLLETAAVVGLAATMTMLANIMHAALAALAQRKAISRTAVL